MNSKPYRRDPASAPPARDAPEMLPGMPDGPAGRIVTSPPHRGTRDYGVTGQDRRAPGPGSSAATPAAPAPPVGDPRPAGTPAAART